jgi:hypothetical protein
LAALELCNFFVRRIDFGDLFVSVSDFSQLRRSFCQEPPPSAEDGVLVLKIGTALLDFALVLDSILVYFFLCLQESFAFFALSSFMESLMIRFAFSSALIFRVPNLLPIRDAEEKSYDKHNDDDDNVDQNRN